MLSPIATVLFPKLRHLGQSDAGATSPKPLSVTSTPCMINVLSIQARRSRSAWCLLFNWLSQPGVDATRIRCLLRKPQHNQSWPLQAHSQTWRQSLFLFAVSAGSSATSRALSVAVFPGSRWGRIEKPISYLRPSFSSPIPIVLTASCKPRGKCGNISDRREPKPGPLEHTAWKRLISQEMVLTVIVRDERVFKKPMTEIPRSARTPVDNRIMKSSRTALMRVTKEEPHVSS